MCIILQYKMKSITETYSIYTSSRARYIHTYFLFMQEGTLSYYTHEILNCIGEWKLCHSKDMCDEKFDFCLVGDFEIRQWFGPGVYKPSRQVRERGLLK